MFWPPGVQGEGVSPAYPEVNEETASKKTPGGGGLAGSRLVCSTRSTRKKEHVQRSVVNTDVTGIQGPRGGP